MVQGNQSDTTKCIANVLTAPVTQPISGTEQKLLGGLLHRLSHQHQSQFGLPVYTGGRPAHISFTPIATALDNTSVSDRTQRRRRQTLQAIEKTVCGNEATIQAQRSFCLSRSTQAEREQLLFSAKIHHYVSPSESLSIFT